MIVDCAVYDDGRRRAGSLDLDDALEAAREPGSFVWIGLYEPEEPEFEAVVHEFELHPLAVEDLLHPHKRPKVEVFGDTVLFVLRTACWNAGTASVDFGELQVLAGEHFVITVRHGTTSALAGVRRQLEDEPEHLRLGPAAVVHTICDRVVDDYQPVIEGLEQEIDDIEAQVFSDGRENPAERIYRLKRQVLALYRSIEPLSEALTSATKLVVLKSEIGLVEYFHDVEDHLRRTVTRTEVARGFLLSDALSANLAEISLRQNEDMRTISAWAAVIAVPTMLAGIWGMNFEEMPELEWRIGYPTALLVIVGAALAVYLRLKRSKWL